MKERFFKTLDDLVYYYMKRNRGLVTRLRRPVKRKQPINPEVTDEEPDYESV